MVESKPEPIILKEIFSTSNQRIALQARLILGGEALLPNKINLGKIKPEQLSGINQETVGRINNASTKERSDYWIGKGDFDQQLNIWCGEMVRYVNNPQFTEKEAMEFYQHYFGENKGKSDINIFVDEVITQHTQDGIVNFDQLSQNLQTIKKMAHIFGGNSAEIIEGLVLARAKLTDQAKKQELIDQANEEKTVDDSPTLRINYLNRDEERLLKWLEGNDQPEKRTTKTTESQQLQQARQRQNELIEKKWREINQYPAREIDLGKTQTGEGLKVNLGISNIKNEREKKRLDKDGWALLEYPNTPYVFIANQLLIENNDRSKTLSNLADVCVISAHGMRYQNGSWRFVNGQPVYDTVSAFNKFARLNNLPQIEFITSCDNEAPNQMTIVGLDTGLGPIIQSHLKPIHGVTTYNKRLGKIFMTVSGNFKMPESLASWKKEFIYEPIDQTHKPKPKKVKAVFRKESEEKLPSKTENIDFTVSYERNRKMADHFISVLRDPQNLRTDPEWPTSYLVHDFGFVFDRDGKGGTINNPELLATRYHLPFAIYSNHLIPEISHANLVIRGPHLDSQDNQWKITIYNPYQSDIREETLENVHNQQEALAKISYNKLWEREFLHNNEDLSFANDPELRPYYDVLTNAKLAPFQQDMINCYPYCFFVSSMLNALKPGQTDFKTKGIAQFSKDYQLNIGNRDEILKKLRQQVQL